MKRKILCTTCNKYCRDVNGKVIMFVFENDRIAQGLSRTGECLECGDIRRDKIEREKQARLNRVFAEEDDTIEPNPNTHTSYGG